MSWLSAYKTSKKGPVKPGVGREFYKEGAATKKALSFITHQITCLLTEQRVELPTYLQCMD